MRYRFAKRFLAMFCTAEILRFCGLDYAPIAPKTMIIITGMACGLASVLFALWEG